MITHRSRSAAAIAALISVATAGAGLARPAPTLAQVIVHDPTNYSQNLLQAARALQSVNNQIQSLQNEATGLINQARNLTALPTSSLAALQAQMDRTRDLMRQAEGLAYEVADIDRAFAGRYGPADLSADDQALMARAQARWQDSVAGFQGALQVQAGVVNGLNGAEVELSRLVEASQGAVGALQTAQAGNQLLALQASQLADLSALLAAQGRAQALEAADRAATRADARVRFSRFMSAKDTPQ